MLSGNRTRAEIEKEGKEILAVLFFSVQVSIFQNEYLKHKNEYFMFFYLEKTMREKNTYYQLIDFSGKIFSENILVLLF